MSYEFIEWDENNPPPPGEYVVYHPNFRTPGEKVWTFRAAENSKYWGTDKVRWSYKKGQCVWFNEGNWQVDGAPTHYLPLPRFKNSAPQPAQPSVPVEALKTLAEKWGRELRTASSWELMQLIAAHDGKGE